MPSRRSPNCPALTLADAIERVEKIYQVQGRNPFDGLRAVELMDYTGLNGASRRALGAVRAFGLVTGRGKSLCVSDDAVLIIADAEARDQAERNAALLRSLCNNRVFADLQEQFGARATVNDLAGYLQKKYGFKPGAARKTARIYRSSAAMVTATGADFRERPDVSVSVDYPAFGQSAEAGLATATPPSADEHEEGTSATALKRAHADNNSTTASSSLGQCHDRFSLAGSAVELTWPTRLSPAQFEDLTDWLILTHRKIARESGNTTSPRLVRKKS